PIICFERTIYQFLRLTTKNLIHFDLTQIGSGPHIILYHKIATKNDIFMLFFPTGFSTLQNKLLNLGGI
ncbi:hypothetical protein, partial [Escherichia coli]|uniref:hypothetical protein n=1 Tax=Escherichia coli TaxID=562 RepID=UPI0032DB8477